MTPAELQVVPKEESITPSGLLQMAVAQNADIDKLTKLLELQERWEANEARKAFNAAMARFKTNPPPITKNKVVSFGKGENATKYSHATLDNVTSTITAALSAVGISHKWRVSQAEQIAVTCVLTHEFGHSEETTLRAGADTSGSKNSIQAIGSTVTYLERYTLLAAVGMAAADDDDGKGAAPAPIDKLAEAIVLERLEWIGNSRDLAELTRVYTHAAKMAQDVGDKDAEMKFKGAANARRVAIREGK
jgi:hypothetical protein